MVSQSPQEKILSRYNPKPKKAARSMEGLLFIGVAAAIWIWVSIYASTVYQPKYAAKSLVLIKDSAITSHYVVPAENYAIQTTSSSSANPVLNTMGLLKSEAISQALYDYLQKNHPEELQKHLIKTKAQWDRFYSDGKAFIKAKNQPGTDLITIQFSWHAPIIAKEGLDTILRAFSNASLNLNRSEQHSKSIYLEAQVGDIAKALEKVRQEKSRYKEAVGSVNLAKESDTLATQGIEMATRLSQVEATAQGKEAEFKRYEKMLGMPSDDAITASALGLNKTLSKLQDQLYQLNQRNAELRTTLTEKNPKLKEIQSQIQSVKLDIQNELNRTLGSNAQVGNHVAIADEGRGNIIRLMATAQAEAINLNTEANVLRERMAEIDQQIKDFPNKEEALANLDEKERSLSSALSAVRQKEIEAKLKEAETLSNVFVVDQPQLPTKVKFPDQIQLLILGILFGIAAGVGAVALKRSLLKADLTVQSPQVPDLCEVESTKPDSLPNYAYKKNLYASVPQGSAIREKNIGSLKARLQKGLSESKDGQNQNGHQGSIYFMTSNN